jgi:hypothetical protein
MPRAHPHKQTSASASATIATPRQEALPLTSANPPDAPGGGDGATHANVIPALLAREAGEQKSAGTQVTWPRECRSLRSRRRSSSLQPIQFLLELLPQPLGLLVGQPVGHLWEDGAIKCCPRPRPGQRLGRARLRENVVELGAHAGGVWVVALRWRRTEHVELVCRDESVLPVDASHACPAQSLRITATMRERQCWSERSGAVITNPRPPRATSSRRRPRAKRASGNRPGPRSLSRKGRVPCRASLRRSALLVELEQPLQDLLVREIDRPAVGLGHGGIQIAVRIVEPRGALVVEIGERALLEDGSGLAPPPPRGDSITVAQEI